MCGAFFLCHRPPYLTGQTQEHSMPAHILIIMLGVAITAGAATVWALSVGGMGYITLALPVAMSAAVGLRGWYK